jgi:cytochrome c oxidase subunit IV
MADTHAVAHTDDHKPHVAPGLVLLILAVVTLIEYLATIARLGNGTRLIVKETLVPMLLALSFVKAALVALYFMHLRYEKIIYGVAFIAPTLFALLLLSILSVG